VRLKQGRKKARRLRLAISLVDLRLKKLRSNSVKADVTPKPERSDLTVTRMGTRCWSGGGREALVWPRQTRGRKLT
jgi:hypothetical protein